MRITVQIQGDKELIRKLKVLGDRAPHAMGSALFQEAEEIMGDSEDNYVPVDQSVLKNSGHVELPEYHGFEVLVRMGYGGAAEAYALVQHENLTYHHTVGGPKYLERPVLAHSKGMGRRIGERLNDFIRRQAK